MMASSHPFQYLNPYRRQDQVAITDHACPPIHPAVPPVLPKVPLVLPKVRLAASFLRQTFSRIATGEANVLLLFHIEFPLRGQARPESGTRLRTLSAILAPHAAFAAFSGLRNSSFGLSPLKSPPGAADGTGC
jgi:hypothetical protein